MTPKEKASELVEKFISHTRVFHEVLGWEDYIDSAKACAIIAVDEILNNFGLTTNGKIFYTEYRAIEYWQQVKTEIENL